MGTRVDAPPPRDYYGETAETLQAKVDLAPRQYDAEATYRPRYAELDLGILRDSLLGENGLLNTLSEANPQLSAIENQANTAAREAQIADVERLGSRAVEAIKGANPEAARLQDLLTQRATDQMSTQGVLDPELRREYQQSIRGAQSARGMGYGARDIAEEAAFSSLQADQLRRGRESFASSVASLNAATQQDPFLAVLGRQGTPVNTAMGAAGMGQAFNPGQMFNPESAYASDLYNTNYNAQAAANIASANNKAGLFGGLMGAAGSIGGGFLGNEGLF
tara:strand:- start:403 stop:1239 length:837 start_codon:yes stop_codon:yes gene_type:complete